MTKRDILFEAARFGYVSEITYLCEGKEHDFSFFILTGEKGLDIEVDIETYRSETIRNAPQMVGLVKRTDAHACIHFTELKMIIEKKNRSFHPSTRNPTRTDLIIMDGENVLMKIHYDIFLEIIRKELKNAIINTPYSEVYFLTKGHMIIPLKKNIGT